MPCKLPAVPSSSSLNADRRRQPVAAATKSDPRQPDFELRQALFLVSFLPGLTLQFYLVWFAYFACISPFLAFFSYYKMTCIPLTLTCASFSEHIALHRQYPQPPMTINIPDRWATRSSSCPLSISNASPRSAPPGLSETFEVGQTYSLWLTYLRC